MPGIDQDDREPRCWDCRRPSQCPINFSLSCMPITYRGHLWYCLGERRQTKVYRTLARMPAVPAPRFAIILVNTWHSPDSLLDHQDGERRSHPTTCQYPSDVFQEFN